MFKAIGKDRGRPLDDPVYSQDAGEFTPKAEDHSRTVELWIPYPPEPGKHFVRFSLLDERRQPLDVKKAPFVAPPIPAVR